MESYENTLTIQGPRVDAARCDCCGWCIQLCPHDVLTMGPKAPYVHHPERCNECLACEENCPEGAIEVAFAILWGKDVSIQNIKEDA